mmetsp:Transcript_24256/g.35939  ORF Transcript_24256/g.35939 Transcript_24256/m.35939 type:complete len:272 (-) Transcript_24256:309-1124(-)
MIRGPFSNPRLCPYLHHCLNWLGHNHNLITSDIHIQCGPSLWQTQRIKCGLIHWRHHHQINGKRFQQILHFLNRSIFSSSAITITIYTNGSHHHMISKHIPELITNSSCRSYNRYSRPHHKNGRSTRKRFRIRLIIPIPSTRRNQRMKRTTIRNPNGRNGHLLMISNLYPLQCIQYTKSTHHLSKHHMLPIALRQFPKRHEELRRITILTAISHGDDSHSIMFEGQSPPFIFEFLPVVDGFSSASVSHYEVTALYESIDAGDAAVYVAIFV